MAEIKNANPYRNMKYQLQIAGQAIAGFSEAVFPGDGSDKTDTGKPAGSGMQRRFSGLTGYSALTLNRGLTDSPYLQNWYMDVQLTGTSAMPKEVALVLLNEAGGQGATIWKIAGAWPSRYQVAELKATDTQEMIITLVLQLESIEEV